MGSQLKNNPIDNELARKIRDRIKWDKRVSPADFDVVVRGCAVIISGYVDTSYKKMAALELVSDVDGVWSIEDRIVVPSDYHRTDDELKAIITNAVDEMIKIGGEHLEVDVVDGIVKFEGEVFRPRLKALAVCSAWELSGVRDVVDEVHIIEPPRRLPLTVEYFSNNSQELF
ncbi:MAG: BON domain-containing protein [Bdellovibrio sp.]|nr:BON domain-containing protein [Bdellovibrio sp.]